MKACLFDLDGVLTETAKVHAAAWKEMFDAFLQARARERHEAFVAFDPVGEYDAYMDGKPRADGTRSFLAARGIELPEGGPDDPPSSATIAGLSNAKNEIVLRRIHADGVQAYTGSIAYVRAVRDAGLRRAVLSSSANCADGLTAKRDHLAGKPAPDMFLAAAHGLEVAATDAAVFEDALAGVVAGHAGDFGFVVGVDRTGQASELEAHDADVVVNDLAKLLESS
jgi:HAD superfamily hydrolase (TIGR01509 family)